MLHSVRHWISFLVGALVFLLGLFPLIGKSLGPVSSIIGGIAAYIVAFAGLYIIVDSFFEFSFHSGVGLGTLIIGLLVFSFGIVVVLSLHGIISFKVPEISMFIYNVLFILEGLFLMLGSFIMD